MRLTTTEGGEHHITIPHHKSLRVGTLSAILRDVAEHVDLGAFFSEDVLHLCVRDTQHFGSLAQRAFA